MARLLLDVAAVKWTRSEASVQIFGLAQHYPTLRDWIAANFHEKMVVFFWQRTPWNERNRDGKLWREPRPCAVVCLPCAVVKKRGKKKELTQRTRRPEHGG